MADAPRLHASPRLPDEIKDAAQDGHLVLFVGAGASMLRGMPSWNGLADRALDEIRSKSFLDYSDIEQLKSLDPKKKLSIAKLMASDNRIDLDLEKYLKAKSSNQSKVYEYINSIGSVYVTTNYDEEIKPIINIDDDVSGPPTPKRIVDPEDIKVSHLGEPGTVIHLHGGVSDPKTMVLTTKDYLEQYDKNTIKSFLKELFTRKTILFIGYGLEEAEILEHILRRAEAKMHSEKRYFLLQGYFSSQNRLYERLYQYYLKSFGVSLIGFSKDKDSYNQLEKILLEWADDIIVRPSSLMDDIKHIDEVLGNV